MAEWLYKATPKKVTFEATRDLAVDDGFLCRAAYNKADQLTSNTKRVKHGDILHMYFVQDGQPRTIGAFEIVGPNRHPGGSAFAHGVQGTVLRCVTNPEFAARLASLGGDEGYKVDPVKKAFTGWLLRLRDDVATPAYDAAVFPGEHVLVQRKS